jgi:Kef-type K+ transport system membrane component KefB
MHLDLMNLLLVLSSAWLAGRLTQRLGYPAVLGELLVGILLGPPLLGLLHGGPALSMLAELGVLLMMLYVGMEVDPRELRRASWPGLPAALAGFALPFALALWVTDQFGGTPMSGIFLGIAAGMTSLATGSRILSDMKLLDTRLAHVMMTAALVADTLALLIFAGATSAGGEADFAALTLIGVKVAAFFVLVALVGVLALPFLWGHLHKAGLTDRTSHFTLVLVTAVLFGELAEIAGLHAILGAFVAGMFLRENVLGRSLSHELMGVVREASLGFLAPIFFVTAGFHVSFTSLLERPGLFLAVLAVAVVGKIVAVSLSYVLTGHGWREGVVTGAAMNGRGAVEIIIAGLGYELGLLSQEFFSVLVVASLCATALTPPLLKPGVAWLARRGELIRHGDARRGVVIVSAGATARALARALKGARPVCLVDANPERCELARTDGLEVICGDALQEVTLSRAGAGAAATLVAMTSNTEVNALVAKMARSVFEVPDVHFHTAGNLGSGRTSAMRHLGAKDLFGGGPSLEQWDRWIHRDEVDHSEIPAAAMPTEEELVEESTEDDPSLILAIRRGDDVRPYSRRDKLRESDELILLTRRSGQ